jgi:TonB family protein
VNIEAQSQSGNSRQYNVQIFDAESRTHIAHLKLSTSGDTPAEAETSAGDTTYTINIQPHGEAYLLNFTAENGPEVIDTMRAGFTPAAKTQPTPSRPSRGGHDVKEPTLLHRVDALYTDDARAAGAIDAVTLELLIDKSGFVREATILQPMGHGLSESALDAVKQWQFEPSTQDRVPVEVTYEVRLEFKP